MLIIDADKANKDVLLTRIGCTWFLWLNLLYSLYLCFRYFLHDPIETRMPAVLMLSLAVLLFSLWNLLLSSQLVRHQFYLSRPILSISVLIYGVLWGLILYLISAEYAANEFGIMLSIVVLFPAVVAFHLSLLLTLLFAIPVLLAVYVNIFLYPAINPLFALFSYTLAMCIVFSCRQVMLEWYRKSEKSEQMNLRLIQKLTRLADQDPLTGLANKRYLREYFYARAAHFPADYAAAYLIMIDVDYFKRFNDTYGHIAGDQCLIRVSKCIARSVRDDSDLSVRFGGEEFAVLLLNADREAAIRVCERIKQNLAECRIPNEKSDVEPWVTVSQGGACWRSNMSLEQLITQADQQLYQSKHAGRNRITFESVLVPET